MAPQVMAKMRGTTTKDIDGDVSWHGFKGRYLESRLARKQKPDTIAHDKRAFEYIDKEFPIQRLQDVTPALLESFQSRLLAKQKSNINTNRMVRSIKTAMRKAESWDLIGPQNWLKFKMLREPKGKLYFYSIEDCPKLLRIAKGVWKTFTYLGFRAGLRREEMRELKWSMVNLKDSMLRVEQSGTWIPKGYEARAIPLSADLKEHLQSLPDRTGYVLGADRPALDSMTTYFRRIAKKSGLKGSPHTLRHTFGAHLAQAGASPQQIKELMGHASLKTTEIYMHLSPGNLRSAIGMLPLVPVLVPGSKKAQIKSNQKKLVETDGKREKRALSSVK
jgi:integrase